MKCIKLTLVPASPMFVVLHDALNQWLDNADPDDLPPDQQAACERLITLLDEAACSLASSLTIEMDGSLPESEPKGPES